MYAQQQYMACACRGFCKWGEQPRKRGEQLHGLCRAAVLRCAAPRPVLAGPPKQQQQQQHTQLLRVGKEGGHVGQGRAGDDDHDKTS